jgi:hypothetical protein
MKTVIISASIFAGVISVQSQIEPQKIARVKEIKAKKIKKAKVEKKEAVHIVGDSKIKK